MNSPVVAAARLRESAAAANTPFGLVDALDSAAFGDGSMHTCAEVAERLADLIEPEVERTCRLTVDDSVGLIELYPCTRYVCDSCGGYFDSVDGAFYCPNCGAKVLKVGE